MQQLNLLKAKQKALVEQIEKEKIQSNKGSSYKLLVEQAKLKQATSKVRLWRLTNLVIHLQYVVDIQSVPVVNHVVLFFTQHFKDLIRLRRTAEWPRSTLDSEASVAKETPEVELLPFTLSHERCICVVQKLALFLLSMDFTCHADLLLFVCKVQFFTFTSVSEARLLKKDVSDVLKCSQSLSGVGQDSERHSTHNPPV